jgi:hypothetical protein
MHCLAPQWNIEPNDSRRLCLVPHRGRPEARAHAAPCVDCRRLLELPCRRRSAPTLLRVPAVAARLNSPAG